MDPQEGVGWVHSSQAWRWDPEPRVHHIAGVTRKPCTLTGLHPYQ